VLLSFRGVAMGCEWCHFHREQSTRCSQMDDNMNIINEEMGCFVINKFSITEQKARIFSK
jgi:hypothetical protein